MECEAKWRRRVSFDERSMTKWGQFHAFRSFFWGEGNHKRTMDWTSILVGQVCYASANRLRDQVKAPVVKLVAFIVPQMFNLEIS